MRRIIVAAALAVLVVAVPLLALSQTKDNVKRNQDVIREYIGILNSGDMKAASMYIAEDSKNFGRPVGREGMRLTLEDIRTTFPDFRLEIMEMVAEGDSVVVRCTFSGTHRGVGKRPVNGGMLVGVEPTQKHFEVQHIHWYRLRDGKIVEHWATRDDIGMMRQLGLLPPVASPNTK